MSKSKYTEPHRVMSGPVHPAVTMAVLIAQQAYANRTTDVTVDQFERMLDSVCIGDAWNDPPINTRTVVLMVMTALQFGSSIESTVCQLHYEAAAKAADGNARSHALMTAGAIASLGDLANSLAINSKQS